MFSGCSSTKPQVVVKERTLPSWYTNPPLSNTIELYALGEGKNKKEAIAQALSFMASTLSVSIIFVLQNGLAKNGLRLKMQKALNILIFMY